ncbi:MAG: trehalase family glycosidase [Hyphomicrobiaceae bacterium]
MTSILETPSVAVSRAWNSWAADNYLEMIFKPLGVRVTPIVYSAAQTIARTIGPGADVVLGPHATDGSHVEIAFSHAGTELEWLWHRDGDPYALEGRWRTKAHGEWALRFWVILALSSDQGDEWSYDPVTGIASLVHGPRTIALKAEKAPLLVTGHESIAALTEEYKTRGYWYLDSRAETAPVLALRFNLEEAAENRFSIAIADRPDIARSRVVAALETPAAEPESPAEPTQQALRAVRDIVGWNTVWDSVNHRPYTTCSRNWDLKKFGGFGFWLNDTAINALLASLFDPEQARENLAVVLFGQTPEGNLPCLITGNDAWVDRTQAPLVAFITWQLYLRTGALSLLEESYPVLAANNDWLRRVRDGNDNGLLEYGSSPVGRGLYVGTKLAAKDESFMDNSPMHDEARWHEASRTLDSEDVGLNCFAALDCEMLGRMAEALGQTEAAASHRRDADRLRNLIRTELWDDRRKIFANRLWSGKFVESLTPTSFLPMLAAAASKEQIAHLLTHLENPRTFGGDWVIPSVAKDDPAAKDNVYWRGRIWPILCWLTWHGLKRAGEVAAAGRLASKTRQLFETSWQSLRLAPENYNALTGEGLDQLDTDPFYSWTALLPLMTVSETLDISPFDGLSLGLDGADETLGPIATALGRVTVERRNGTTSLLRHGRPLLIVKARGRLTHLSVTPETIMATLPPADRASDWLKVPLAADERIVAAFVDGAPAEAVASKDMAAVNLAASSTPRRVTILRSRI